MTTTAGRLNVTLIKLDLPLRREAASDWGLQCMRYEIRDINPPAGVRAAMELQARCGGFLDLVTAARLNDCSAPRCCHRDS